MDATLLIQKLKDSGLYAECPKCNGEFRLAKAVMFDGTKPFPNEALQVQKELTEEIEDRKKELEKRKKLTTEKAEITTRSVNVGKNLEKILPTLKDFKWELPDSRHLGDPIDLIVFNGLAKGKVNSLHFIEAKSGNAKLNEHQRAIRDAIEDEKVSYKVFK